MAGQTVHLICNSHIDPVWLWEWEEGAAEAVSTFRAAAEFCEKFDGFVFCHNEVVLYEWVEEYEPELFERIRRLVGQKKWHVMGGWYLQPDCNMPSGESFVRQILTGRRYFKEKFGVKPTTAINFDPFGHTRGLVQIMVKSGYDSYLFCRPGQKECPLPADDFTWVGFDGSELAAHRANGYTSRRGQAAEKVRGMISAKQAEPVLLVLWGVGNHGGGASRKDLRDLAALRSAENKNRRRVLHSTPEAFFRELRRRKKLPKFAASLQPWAVGCYSSMARVKQKHRLLENELYAAEKTVAAAAYQGLLKYPKEELAEALRDLLGGEFHDALPGSSIQPVEEAVLRALDHGLEIVSRVRARAFFASAAGQPKAVPGQIPILVYNPHPYPVRGVVECEFQLPDHHLEETFVLPKVFRDGVEIPSQVEKESSNVPTEWRKRMVFETRLTPSGMNRFDCRLETLPKKPAPALKERNGRFHFKTKELEVVVNARTGLLDCYRSGGTDFLYRNAFRPLVIQDNEDSWGMEVRSFRKKRGAFRLMSATESARFSGVAAARLKPVRVIEDGPVRSVVEAVFAYDRSALVLRYKLPKRGTAVEIEVVAHWNEKDKMLKLSLPTTVADGEYLGQTAYGRERLPENGDEAVAQKWTAVVDRKRRVALTCINDGVYGSDFLKGEWRLTLLRSSGYSAHPLWNRTVMPQDRFSPRMDQGERRFRFWLDAGPLVRRLNSVEREAAVKNEKPFALSFFPPGGGAKPKPFLTLSDEVIVLAAAKQAETGGELTVRLFEPTGKVRRTTLALPFAGMKIRLAFTPFEIKTLKINPRRKTWAETDLTERPLPAPKRVPRRRGGVASAKKGGGR